MADKIEVGEIHDWFNNIYLVLPNENCICLSTNVGKIEEYDPYGRSNPIGVEGYLDYLSNKHKDRNSPRMFTKVDYSQIKIGQLFCINGIGKDTHIFVKLDGTACARFLLDIVDFIYIQAWTAHTM